MMNKHTSIICSIYFCLILGAFETRSQIITIRQGSPVIVDGQMFISEWADADSILIPLNASTDVTVKFKHDGSNFNFSFFNNLESFNIRFPEIMFDINNDKSLGWLSDDWWFHVSATDCESNTAANDYGNCQTIQPGWVAANNFSSGPPLTDTVEIQIPFSKVNFSSTVTDTIGLVFDVTNTFSAWNYWPDQSVIGSQPATWGTAIVEFGTSSIDEFFIKRPGHWVSPNPVRDLMLIHHSMELNGPFEYTILGIQGKSLKTFSRSLTNSTNYSVDLSELTGGVYFLECKGTDTYDIIKFIVTK